MSLSKRRGEFILDASTLKTWLHDGSEIALLDVREHGQYGQAHIFQAAPLPYSRLEIDIARLVPRRPVRIVVYDDDDGVAQRAQAALRDLGYDDVWILEGGLAAWQAAGLNVFAGVNVPSKTFGELAELAYRTPHISAEDLAGRLLRQDNLVVLDGRPFAEYQKMSIPGAVCCPNGELALHAMRLAPDPATTIVVNCAGRTRSIIGAQTLINLGVPNPVLALENGTQGWYLEDFTLDAGATRRHDLQVEGPGLDAARERAQALAARARVRTIAAEQAGQWLSDPHRTTFLCDVRTAEEFAAGSLPGAQHTPGGQLLQATDQYVAVRGARLVLFDSEGVRARVVASWLVQMGWEAVVLEEGAMATLTGANALCRGDASAVPPDDVPASAPGDTPKSPPGDASTLPPGYTTAGRLHAAPKASILLPSLAATSLADAMRAGATLLDVRSSQAYRAAHIAQARWAIRPRLAALNLAGDTRVVLLASDGDVAALVARDLISLGLSDIAVNLDAPQAWREAGLTLVSTPDSPTDADCIDFLFFVHDRHDGNKQAARQYLAWETNLIHQIDAQEQATFDFTRADAVAPAT